MKKKTKKTKRKLRNINDLIEDAGAEAVKVERAIKRGKRKAPTMVSSGGTLLDNELNFEYQNDDWVDISQVKDPNLVITLKRIGGPTVTLDGPVTKIKAIMGTDNFWKALGL